MHTAYNIVPATSLSSHLPTVVCDQIVNLTIKGKSEQFRVFSINPCSAGRSSDDMTARGWEPVVYGCERVIAGSKKAPMVVVAYRSLKTGDFSFITKC